MLNKVLSLVVLASVVGLTACTNANQPGGQSQVRQTPDNTMTNQDQYGSQPMGGTGTGTTNGMSGDTDPNSTGTSGAGGSGTP